MPSRGTSLQRFLTYLRPYRLLVALAAVLGIVRYLIPLALPWAVKVLVDDYLVARAARPPIGLDVLMAGLVALFLVFGVVSYWRSYLAGLAGHRLIFDLRRDLYQHVQRMSLSFFERRKIGAVVARMTSDIASAQNFVGAAFVNTAMDLASIAAILVVLWLAHWKLALVAVVVLPFYAVISHPSDAPHPAPESGHSRPAGGVLGGVARADGGDGDDPSVHAGGGRGTDV